MQIPLKYMKKTKGGRLSNVTTFKAYCKENKHIVPSAWLQVNKTIKPPESDTLFGHVALGNFHQKHENVIVKVYDEDDLMLTKELSVLKNLTKHSINNIVKLHSSQHIMLHFLSEA